MEKQICGLVLIFVLALVIPACSTNPVWGLVDESVYTGQKSDKEIQEEKQSRLMQMAFGLAAATPQQTLPAESRNFK